MSGADVTLLGCRSSANSASVDTGIRLESLSPRKSEVLTFLDSRKRGSALGCVGMYRGISDSNRYDQVGKAHRRGVDCWLGLPIGNVIELGLLGCCILALGLCSELIPRGLGMQSWIAWNSALAGLWVFWARS